MIISLTDAEALALSQQLQAKARTIGGTLIVGDGLAEVNVEALESAKTKIQAAMQKSDAKLGRSLDYAISSLESSGFDSEQLTALRGAKDKATIHNESKYVKKGGEAGEKKG